MNVKSSSTVLGVMSFIAIRGSLSEVVRLQSARPHQALSHPLIFRRRQFATSDTYLDPEILVLRVLRHRILRRDHR